MNNLCGTCNMHKRTLYAKAWRGNLSIGLNTYLNIIVVHDRKGVGRHNHG